MSRTKYNLGQITQPTIKPTAIDKFAVLEELEKYLTYEKRLSRQNTRAIIRGARYLIERYNVTMPCLDDAMRIEEDMRGRGVKNSTIRLRLYDLEYLAASMELHLQIKKPKRTKNLGPAFLSPVEARALLDAARNQRDKAIIAVLLYCGLRNKELCNLHTSDLDLKNRLLYVKDNGQGIKNYHERRAVLTQECAQILKDWLSCRSSVNCPMLFVTMYGDKINQGRLEKIIRDTAQSAGISKRVYPHMLRHSCASNMLKAGVTVTEVMLQLGHQSLQSTMIYLHGDLAGLRESIDKQFKY